MNGKELRALMNKSLKEIVVPFLRENGFKGSFPHFRRIKSDRINLLTFQFSMSGPKFVVEISNCSPKGVQLGWGADIPPAKCTAHDMDVRHRIGDMNHGDKWFDFSFGAENNKVFDQRANEIISFWDKAEDWWQVDLNKQRLAKVPVN